MRRKTEAQVGNKQFRNAGAARSDRGWRCVAYDAVAERHPEAAVIILPRTTAIPSETTTTQRDGHLAGIAKHGRMNWQRSSGYNRRSLAETAMLRYKAIIGSSLRARPLPAQKTEARAVCSVLNRMTSLGMPVSQRIA